VEIGRSAGGGRKRPPRSIEYQGHVLFIMIKTKWSIEKPAAIGAAFVVSRCIYILIACVPQTGVCLVAIPRPMLRPSERL